MTQAVSAARSLVAGAVRGFPRGGLLPRENWRRRHLALSLVLAWHMPLLVGYGLSRGASLPHALVDGALPGVLALAAVPARLGRAVRAVLVAAGLLTCSVMLVHLSHGLIEAHFHFFVVVALLSLYQDWKPFLVAIGVTVVEHGVTGVMAPTAVYNHPDAWAHPWKWAFIHGAFVLAASAAGITAWAMSEADHRRVHEATAALHAERVEVLSHKAHHDPLTGLPNRRMVLDHLTQACNRSARAGTLVGVLFVDLDGFKQVNDTYGHTAGDVVLRATADHLRSAVRGTDLAARLGGDEFLVVCEGLSGRAALEAARRRVVRAVSTPVAVDEHTVLVVSASVGCVLSGGDEPATSLIEGADADMYRVKHLRRSGRTVAPAL